MFWDASIYYQESSCSSIVGHLTTLFSNHKISIMLHMKLNWSQWASKFTSTSCTDASCLTISSSMYVDDYPRRAFGRSSVRQLHRMKGLSLMTCIYLVFVPVWCCKLLRRTYLSTDMSRGWRMTRHLRLIHLAIHMTRIVYLGVVINEYRPVGWQSFFIY